MEGLTARQNIVSKITAVYDTKTGTQIPISTITVEFGHNKYSAKKLAVWRVIINGRRLGRKDALKFDYNCHTCGSKQQLIPISLMRKVNKCSLECVQCVNLNEGKRQAHSDNFPSYADRAANAPQKPITYIEKRDASLEKFRQMDEEYKSKYFAFHLTQEDYARLLPKIQSFQNGKVTDFANIEYWPVYNSLNQMNFTHIMYNRQTQTVFKPHQPILKCDNCKSTWRAKSLEVYKNHMLINCRTCSLTNTIFKVRPTTNNLNELITYQSKLELKFIKWCDTNGITARNGPILPYEFNGKQTSYRVDFLVGRILIEIKDNHDYKSWHKNQLASGYDKLGQAKESIARSEVALGHYDDFMLIDPKNWIASLKTLKTKLMPQTDDTNLASQNDYK